MRKLNHIQLTWLKTCVELGQWQGCWIPQPTGAQLAIDGLVKCIERKGNNRCRYIATQAGIGYVSSLTAEVERE